MTSRATHAPYSNWGRSKVALHLEIRPQTRRKFHARGEYQQTPTRQRASPPNVTSQDRRSPLFTTTPFESDSPQGGKASPCPPWGRILTHISYKLESLDLVPVEPSNDRSTRADYLNRLCSVDPYLKPRKIRNKITSFPIGPDRMHAQRIKNPCKPTRYDRFLTL